MVGRDVLLRVDKAPSHAGRAAARGRGPARARRPRPAGRATASSSTVRGGRDRRARRGRRQRPERAHRGDHRPARASTRDRSRVEGRDRTGAGAARMLARRHLAHRRGPPAPRPRPQLLARREPRPARVPDAEAVQLRLAVAAAHDRGAPRRCSASSTSAAASRRPWPRRCRAATSRSASSPARSPATRGCWSPPSRRAGSTSARSSSSTGASWPSATPAAGSC